MHSAQRESRPSPSIFAKSPRHRYWRQGQVDSVLGERYSKLGLVVALPGG
jgi:hypothetical protein